MSAFLWIDECVKIFVENNIYISRWYVFVKVLSSLKPASFWAINIKNCLNIKKLVIERIKSILIFEGSNP